MAKSKIKSTKRLGVLLAAVGIATVLLASYTLARFSTSAGGGGTSSIALWDVTITPQTNTTLPSSSYDSAVSFGKLSPGSKDDISTRLSADNVTGNYLVYNSSSSKQLGTVTYQTSVDVGFTIESSDFTLAFSDDYDSTLTYDGSSTYTITYISGSTTYTATYTDSSLTDGGGNASSTVAYKVASSSDTVIDASYAYGTGVTGSISLDLSDSSTKIPKYSEIIGLYSLIVYYNIGGVTGGDKKFTPDDTTSSIGHTYSIPNDGTNDNGKWEATTDSDNDGDITDEDETEVYIVAKLVWSIKTPESSETGYDISGNYYWASYLCDWVGKYVESVSCSFTYTARQASDTGS